ncbi:hypothetical protein CICLE_v10003731mg [Citrus x clementina]|uniref:ADP-ribosyl cyclase/cyclic ADP-ribose hydrolase n=1 Tax=Citrus clementina TaxID=85681 RepID=V4SBR9_CITCL|nr:hypothetical protein CICLE_v10003731mg [Citrus x clementina]
MMFGSLVFVEWVELEKLCNTLKDQFEASSFLANVREVSVTRGMVPLQEQLLSEVLMERNLIIWDVHKGINLIRWRLCGKRVLVVLDDVDQLEQLQALAGNHDWFGFGSRIIITSRDEHVLKSHGVTNIYKVRGLDYVEALQLFHLKVSKGKQPTDDRVELSKYVVNYAGGLPLAIEVLGSFLCRRSVEEWKSALNRLQEAPNEKVLKRLFKLNLCNSRIKYLWKGIKPFKELKFMNRSHSCNLSRTPDFTGVPNLQRLNLEGCTRLLEVHQSVGTLKRLILLNLKDCRNLVSFPKNVCLMKSLKILCLCGCLKLEKLPQDLGEVECLEELDVGGTAVRQITPSIVQLMNLKIFSLHGCKGQPPKILSSGFFLSLWLPNKNSNSMCLSFPRFTGLSSLQTLNFSDCNLLEGAIPFDIGSLFSVEAIDLSGNNFVSLPSSINQLLKLKIFCLERCRNLKSLPELPPEIVFVGAEGCTLETISINPKLNWTADVALNFSNCFKLAGDQVGRDNLIAMLLEQWLVELPNCSSQFHLFIPGNEIPRWFSYWNIGGSVTIQASGLRSDHNFSGFAVCAVLSLPCCTDMSYMEINVK